MQYPKKDLAFFSDLSAHRQRLSFPRKSIDQRTGVWGNAVSSFQDLHLLRILKGPKWFRRFCEVVHVEISSPSQFHAHAKRNPRCMIESYLSKGVVHSTLVTRKRHGEDRWVPEVSGKLLFDAMMGHFLMKNTVVKSIEGAWLYGSNLAFINALTEKECRPITFDDVGKTWTGKRAFDWGFHKIKILKTLGNPGDYREIVVRFEKQT